MYHSGILERQQPELLDHMSEPIQTHAAFPCWERQKFLIIFMRIPGFERKAAQSDPERRSVTLEHISGNYPEEWTQVCTNGSAIEVTRDGGGWVYIKYRAEEAQRTEMLANLDKTHKKIVFFSDAIKVLADLIFGCRVIKASLTLVVWVFMRAVWDFLNMQGRRMIQFSLDL